MFPQQVVKHANGTPQGKARKKVSDFREKLAPWCRFRASQQIIASAQKRWTLLHNLPQNQRKNPQGKGVCLFWQHYGRDKQRLPRAS
jgi:hypothetical protein